MWLNIIAFNVKMLMGFTNEKSPKMKCTQNIGRVNKI